MTPTQKPVETSTDEVLRLIEKASQKSFLPIIGPQKGSILAEEVRKAKPRHVLEVGTLIGYSAILIGRELDTEAEVVTIELHDDEVKLAGENIQRANIPAKVKIITGDALEVIPTLQGPFDFTFIDAEKSEYYQYLKLAENKLHKGTVVFSDNAGFFADDMRDYLNYVRNSSGYKSRYVQVGDDGVEISVRL